MISTNLRFFHKILMVDLKIKFQNRKNMPMFILTKRHFAANLKKWYFVTIIVLTYYEKKMF